MNQTIVVVVPDFAGSENAARAIYHAVNAYKNQLVSIDKIVISPFVKESGDNLLKNIEEYIKIFLSTGSVTAK